MFCKKALRRFVRDISANNKNNASTASNTARAKARGCSRILSLPAVPTGLSSSSPSFRERLESFPTMGWELMMAIWGACRYALDLARSAIYRKQNFHRTPLLFDRLES